MLEPYRDAFARLKCQRPIAVSDDVWRQAIYDAGLLFDAWSTPLFEQFQWSANDIFAVPRDGKAGGLVWFCAGETVRPSGQSMPCNYRTRVRQTDARRVDQSIPAEG